MPKKNKKKEACRQHAIQKKVKNSKACHTPVFDGVCMNVLFMYNAYNTCVFTYCTYIHANQYIRQHTSAYVSIRQHITHAYECSVRTQMRIIR